MTSRLKKLREQRDLILKLLQWIETEIASEAPAVAPEKPVAIAPDQTSPDPPLAPVKPPVSVDKPEPVVTSALTGVPVETTDFRGLQRQVRRGCLLYFVLAWLALGVTVAAIYFVYS